MKRKRLLTGCVCFAVLVPGIVAVFLFTRPAVVITPARVEQIQPGMTLAEVEAILGGPPGDYANDQSLNGLLCTLYTSENVRFWITNSGGAVTEFDAQGRVGFAVFIDYDAKPWHVRVRRRLGF